MINNLQATIAKYHNTVNHIGNANNNGKILGIEVDSGNMAWYVVKRNGTISLESFSQAQPQLQHIDRSVTVTVKDGKIIDPGTIKSATPFSTPGGIGNGGSNAFTPAVFQPQAGSITQPGTVSSIPTIPLVTPKVTIQQPSQVTTPDTLGSQQGTA